MKVMYNFVAANRVRQSVWLQNQTEQMDNHFVTFIKQRLHQNLTRASDAIFLSNYLLERTAVAHRRP